MFKRIPNIVGIINNTNELQTSIILFTNYIFHEIRVPLNSVVIGIHNLIQSNKIKRNQLKSLKICESSVKNIVTILNEVLDVQKIQSGNFTINKKLVHLYTLIFNIIESFKDYANQKNIEILNKHVTQELHVYLDELRITQCLNN
jgi:signal transduction histidine kinase